MSATLTVDIFISVDGYAGSDGLPGYFGYPGPELQEWIDTAGATPQVMLMGRRTYEALSGLPDQDRDDATNTMTQTDKVIYSRTLTDSKWPNTRISADLIDDVQTLKLDGDCALRTVGSLSIVAQLLDAGVVDRLRLMTFPLIAGPPGREPAFAGLASCDLDLVSNRVLDGRILLVEYAPTGNDIPRL
jgi:dihydrofolate reductase